MADNSNGKKIDDNYFNDTIKKNNSNKKLNKDLKINSESKDNLNETYRKKVLFINRKRGRKIKELNYINIGSSHDRFSNDNLKRKIKTHFHNYIISLLNSKVYDDAIKFVKLDHNIAKDITVEFNQALCNKPYWIQKYRRSAVIRLSAGGSGSCVQSKSELVKGLQ